MTAFTEETAEERKEAKRVRRLHKIAKLNRDTAVNELFKTPEGRDFLWWLLEVGKAIGQQPYNENAHHTAFNCGQMNVGIQLMTHMIEVNPEAFAKMQMEKANEYRSNTDPNSRANASTGADSNSDSGTDADTGTYS